LLLALTPSPSPKGRGEKKLKTSQFPLSSKERGSGGEVKNIEILGQENLRI